MPLTKLARRYHIQKRPQEEHTFGTPGPSGAKMALNFDTPDLPSYVTVRKKRQQRPRRPSIGSLQSTVIESEAFKVSDCKGWKRLESTHIDHIADAMGHLNLSVFTEDISAIHNNACPDDSFKTALEHPHVEAQVPVTIPSFRLENVADWVANSPFQASLSSQTIVIPESDIDEDETQLEGNTEGTSKLNMDSEEVPIGRETSQKSDLSDKDDSIRIVDNDDESIANVWNITVGNQKGSADKTCKSCSTVDLTSSSSDETEGINDTSKGESLSILDQSHRVSESELDTSTDYSANPKDSSSRSVSLQVSLASSSNSLLSSPYYDEEGPPTISTRSVSLQVSMQSGSEEIDNRVSPPCAVRRRPAEHTLSDVSGQCNSQGNVLFIEDDDEDVLSFLTSLSLEQASENCHPDAVKFVKNFGKHKEELKLRLFKLFNEKAFGNVLPSDFSILWNSRLTQTAGCCVQRKMRVDGGDEIRLSKIELSTKVIDSADRLRDTLIHEMCHAATWIKSGVRDGHGPFWKAWSNKAMAAFPELPMITRCHSYAIRTKYTYVCDKCGQRVGRHSKSIDVSKQACKLCGGKFFLLTGKKPS